MATTKIWPTKGHLASVLKYIVNEQKTDAKTYVSGLNCFPDTAAAEMNAVKKHFGKTGGRVAYHAYQSFAPGEVTPDQGMRQLPRHLPQINRMRQLPRHLPQINRI